MDRFDIRIGQHQVEDEMGKGHTAERHLEVSHMGKVGLRRLPGPVHLREDDLLCGTVLRPPGGDVALQRAQLLAPGSGRGRSHSRANSVFACRAGSRSSWATIQDQSSAKGWGASDRCGAA